MRTIIALGILLLTINSCKEVDKLTQFNIDYVSNITIPSTFGVDIPIDIWTPNIPTNSETEFESNNTAKNLIEEIIMTKMSMTITNPNESSFDFLKEIEIYISAEGLAEKKVAWLENIPQTGLKSIELETSTDDLKEYIKADKYKLNTKTVTRQFISQDTDVEINNTFFVDAKILGI